MIDRPTRHLTMQEAVEILSSCFPPGGAYMQKERSEDLITYRWENGELVFYRTPDSTPHSMPAFMIRDLEKHRDWRVRAVSCPE